MRQLAIIFFTGAVLARCADPFGDKDPKQIYKRLLPRIKKIAIFDDHGHPGFADDSDVDAMASPPGVGALRLRPDNPELAEASRQLFGTQAIADQKAKLRARGGYYYFDFVLAKLNIEKALANRVAMPPYLDPARFLWVPFVDSLLFPFNNVSIKARNVDEQTYIPLQEKKLVREMKAAGLSALPSSLGDYLAFIRTTLETEKKAGAVAIKFEAAYFRSLHFEDPPQETAAGVYTKYRLDGHPSDDEYRVFQDFIFRRLLDEAGRLNLLVHFHTAVGIGDFYNLSEGTAMNLENVLRDPRYDRVRFILLHGGFPREREAIWLAARKNVYLDTSLADLYLYPSEFKSVLKYWLSTFPEKVVFGSDAFPFNDTLGAEEAYCLSVTSSRKALAAALAELISEHALTEESAMRVARAYLHDTAAKLYPGP